ncbi:MAG: serine/threonine-protein phosphatase [Eubacterium sp.]|nr:serine/threonine-protein phosphatase [Eubacterium sp.]
MNYIGTAVTDIGISKKTNQDSVCVKIAESEKHGQVAMVVLCDGMGGLAKGELASATVIRAFSKWFDDDLPARLVKFSWKKVTEEWEKLAKEQNYLIAQYGKKTDVTLGTTLTAMLVVDNKYLILHVGDSRIYKIKNSMEQMTEDHTFIAREIKNGRMTHEEAMKDKRRNMLLQCVGASNVIEPQIVTGKVEKNAIYMFCSDGFRHVLTKEEMFERLSPDVLVDADDMEQTSKHLIEEVKKRKEKDNITVALLRTVS